MHSPGLDAQQLLSIFHMRVLGDWLFCCCFNRVFKLFSFLAFSLSVMLMLHSENNGDLLVEKRSFQPNIETKNL